MGLLYVNGERLHDDDAELIEIARERRARYFPPGPAGDEIEQRYTHREVLQSLSAEVRAAARARSTAN